MSKELKHDARTQRSKPAHPVGDQQRGSAQQASKNLYAALSLRDLLDARDQYHVHLMRHPNVMATAIGYYRIRKGDSRPGEKLVVKEAKASARSRIQSYGPTPGGGSCFRQQLD